MSQSNTVPFEGHLDLLNGSGLTARLAFRDRKTHKTTPLMVGDRLVIYRPQKLIKELHAGVPLDRPDPSSEVVAFSGTITGFDHTAARALVNTEHGQLFPWPANVSYQGHVFLDGIVEGLPINLCLQAIAERWRVGYIPTPRIDADITPLPTKTNPNEPLPLPTHRQLKGHMTLVIRGDRGAKICFRDNDTGLLVPLSEHDRLHLRNAQGDTVFNGSAGTDYRTNMTIINARHSGQLFAWPNKPGTFVLVHGIPEGVSPDVWLTAIVEKWDVELAPLPRLLDNSRLNEGDLRVSGILDPFFETGTEGVIWSIYDPRCALGEPYEGLHDLKNGDHLTVYERDGITVRWKGTIKLEYKRNWRPYPMNPQYGQQEVLGFWVHGLQEDLSPEDWARMFFDKLPAVLRRRGTPKRCAAGKKSGKPNTCGSCNCGKKDK